MPKLYIIRHAQVEIKPEMPPPQWRLSAEGKKSVQPLVSAYGISDISCVYHSPEIKAAQTAAIIGKALSVPVRVDDDLRELEMNSGYLSQESFTDIVGRFLEGENIDFFEDYGRAQERIIRSIEGITRAEKGRSVAVVSHGRIIIALLSYLLGRRLGREEWRSMKFPEISVIDLEKGVVEKGYMAKNKLAVSIY